MKKTSMYIKFMLMGVLVVLVASCGPAKLSDLEMASTYAAQTLAAQSLWTETPLPTETPTATPTITATPLPPIEPSGPFDFPHNVNPLTGLIVDDPAILDRRPVFVKVANYPVSGRPHAGLSFADMVFEYYIGAGTNRFIGLYYGQNASSIGPMRSGRLVDSQIVNLYEGILGLVGADYLVLPQMYNILGDRIIDGRSTCPAICDDGANTVISVFANSEEMSKLYQTRTGVQQRYILEGMAFDPQTPQNGGAGDMVKVIYSNLNRGEWRFDEDSGTYLRWIDDGSTFNPEMIPLVDRETDEQLRFSNVVVMFAYHTEYAATKHDIALWDITSGGRAMLFRDGQVFDTTWTTPSRNQPIRFFDQEGEFMPLKPGNTWVVIMGVNSSAVDDAGQWTFNFYLP